MYQIYFYVPESHLEPVKNAMFDAGAGKIGPYDRCSWQVRGAGQFRPLPGSNPHLGERNRIETTDEYRVELVAADGVLKDVLSAFLETHPYEEPAYGVVRIETLESLFEAR